MEGTERKNFLAAAYDWHNSYLLRDQAADIEYWDNVLPNDVFVAVIGAGTGRVAGPLARGRRAVVAVDPDLERLSRMVRLPNLFPVCSEGAQITLSRSFDAIVFPYSTIQLISPGEQLRRSLKNVRRHLARKGSAWLDVSDNFANRTSFDWTTVFIGEWPGMARISEEQRGIRHHDSFKIYYRYRCMDTRRVLAASKETWYFHEDKLLTVSICAAGLRIVDITRGYGDERSKHRRIYRLMI